MNGWARFRGWSWEWLPWWMAIPLIFMAGAVLFMVMPIGKWARLIDGEPKK